MSNCVTTAPDRDDRRGTGMDDASAPDQHEGRPTTLTIAPAHLPSAFIRARTAPLVDLAVAHATAGDRDAALNQA